jgi:hypothetical protein
MVKQKGTKGETVIYKDNTMTKRKGTKGETVIYKENTETYI